MVIYRNKIIIIRNIVGSKGYRGVITTGVSVRTYVGGANA
jgi:hypothetical protein